MFDVLKRTHLALFFAFLCNTVAADSIGIYGLSFHRDDNSGKGYEEENWGLSYHSNLDCGPFIICSTQVGLYRNSYDDAAVWLGMEFDYPVIQNIFVGLDMRHWRTANNSYPDRLLNLYPKVKFKITDALDIAFRLGRSATVMSLRINF